MIHWGVGKSRVKSHIYFKIFFGVDKSWTYVHAWERQMTNDDLIISHLLVNMCAHVDEEGGITLRKE